jgi:hypothetical protein
MRPSNMMMDGMVASDLEFECVQDGSCILYVELILLQQISFLPWSGGESAKDLELQDTEQGMDPTLRAKSLEVYP